MTKKHIFSAALLFLVGFISGYGYERSLIQKEWSAYEKKLEVRFSETGNAFPQQYAEFTRVSGFIRSIEGRTLTVVLDAQRDPFGDRSLDERLIAVDENTSITMNSTKDPEVYKEEFLAYQKDLAEWKERSASEDSRVLGDITEPLVSETRDADFSSLQVGQAIVVTTAENVKDKKNFVASTVLVTGNTGAGVLLTTPTSSTEKDVANTGTETPTTEE